MKTEPKQEEQKRKEYEAPAIIYESDKITTRCGSMIPGPKEDYDVDPVKLFGGL